MDPKSIAWAPHFERTEVRKSRCRHCGLVLDHAGGRPQRHLAEKHPDLFAATAAPEEAPPPDEPLDTKQAFHDTLQFLKNTFGDSSIPANAQVAAAKEYLERLDALGVEEDEEEAEGKVVARFERAIVKKADLEEEFRVFLRDPPTLQRVERLCAEVRATL